MGAVGGAVVLDLDYAEDSAAEVDMNVVMTGAGEFVEIQGTAEQIPFGLNQLQEMLALAREGIRLKTSRNDSRVTGDSPNSDGWSNVLSINWRKPDPSDFSAIRKT